MEKVKVKFSITFDYTEAVNDAIKDGDLEPNDEKIKDFLLDWVCDDIGNHILRYTDIISDLRWKIKQ